MTHSSDAIYALDIGVYNVGVEGQVLATSTAAWCRVGVGTPEFGSLRYSGTPDHGEIRSGETSSWRCGRNMEHLAEAIAADLHNGARVALGFEAPMWLPLGREHRPNFELFAPRFAKEKGHAWYLQAGAAATSKAIGLGVMVFSTLLNQCSGLACATNCAEWQGKTLMLFEAFVAGPYKIPPPASLRDAPNEWDALVAALAWGASHARFRTPDRVRPAVLHGAGARQAECLSVWKAICDASGLPGAHAGPPDCEVVTLSPSGGPSS